MGRKSQAARQRVWTLADPGGMGGAMEGRDWRPCLPIYLGGHLCKLIVFSAARALAGKFHPDGSPPRDPSPRPSPDVLFAANIQL